MKYAYYPGCSLTGSARKLDKAVRHIFQKAGHELVDIPDWNCCGAFEYGDRKELMGFSEANLRKAKTLFGGPGEAAQKRGDVRPEVVAPPPGRRIHSRAFVRRRRPSAARGREPVAAPKLVRLMQFPLGWALP